MQTDTQAPFSLSSARRASRPRFARSMRSTTAGGGVASATLTIGQALGVTLLGFAGLYFASQDRPGDNKKQNRQFRDAMKQLKTTDKDQMRRVYDKIKGKRFGYNELIDFIRDILGLGESFQWIENYSIE